ncbi:MAG: anthranilate synthase component I family protein [Hydrogenothermaceae bacterium]
MVILYSHTDNGWLSKKGYFLFENPVITIRYFQNTLFIGKRKIKTSKPLKFIEEIINSNNLFTVGYISYDFKDYTLPRIVKYPKNSPGNFPLVYLNFYKNYRNISLDEIENFTKIKRYSLLTSKDDFILKVKKAKEYIESGDIYQINLSHRIDIEGIFNPLSIFFKLSKLQPTDYMMYIRDKDFRLISGSMELFLKKEKNKLTTKPIKGTCSKEKDYKVELLESEKERAENLMITDLMRNDLGRICRDVKVEKLFEVEEYKTVYQLSSTVSGKIREDITFTEILKSTFPPGSVTGAPKKRAVEIIEELEDSRRSIYCGSTVLIKPDKDFTMSVAIRQMIFKNQRCYIYVGSGIIWDSDPLKEYEETILKAKANLLSLTL